jgi:hypothetical protein
MFLLFDRFKEEATVAASDNPAERIKQLDQERAKLLGEAKKEALTRANQAVADLVALGFTYTLADDRAPARAKTAKTASRKGTRQIKDAPCSICGFKTAPPHDARRHRFSQGKRKRPFTAKELSDLGLKKVG